MSGENPVIKFVAYDLSTGQVLGRITMNKPEDKLAWPDRLEVGPDITDADFDVPLEVYYDVNPAGRLIRIPLIAAEARGGTAADWGNQPAERGHRPL